MLCNPNNTLVAIPSIDSRMEMEQVVGLLTCLDYFALPPYFYGGNSDIALTRNTMMNRFMQSPFEWMMLIDSDICFSREDWEFLWEGDEDIVTASYSKKVIGQPPVNFGLGFTRVHRSVFQKLNDLQSEDGSSELIPRFYHNGQVMVAYCTSAPSADARWVGEDRQFFLNASMVTAKFRNEQRTKLKHIGRFAYHYPDQIPTLESETGQGAN
jgi:hypothetical protein